MVNEDARARRLRELIRRKEASLAERRARASAPPSLRQVQGLAAAAFAAALAAWTAGLPAEQLAGLGLLGAALAAVTGLQPVFFGIALGCLAAGLQHLRARHAKAAKPMARPRTVLLFALAVVFVGLGLTAGTV